MINRERTGVFCRRDGRILAIELEDPTTRKRFWSFPGGAIETGETPECAAVRETLEETGYRVALTSSAFLSTYEFRWDGEIYLCDTYWYEAELVTEAQDEVDDASYLLRSDWLPWPDARQLFVYNPALTEAVNHFLPT